VLCDTSLEVKPLRKRVLIVEDNPINMKLFEVLLAADGRDMLRAETGIKGIEAAREHRPDLIVMDIGLGDMSGIDATRVLKADELTRPIPIVVITAYAVPGDEARILESGCDRFLPKPISMVQFRETLRSLLGADHL
jgi:two-component system cell cycle response regulator DivK